MLKSPAAKRSEEIRKLSKKRRKLALPTQPGVRINGLAIWTLLLCELGICK